MEEILEIRPRIEISRNKTPKAITTEISETTDWITTPLLVKITVSMMPAIIRKRDNKTARILINIKRATRQILLHNAFLPIVFKSVELVE